MGSLFESFFVGPIANDPIKILKYNDLKYRSLVRIPRLFKENQVLISIPSNLKKLKTH
jgi:hypothetical protein